MQKEIKKTQQNIFMNLKSTQILTFTIDKIIRFVHANDDVFRWGQDWKLSIFCHFSIHNKCS